MKALLEAIGLARRARKLTIGASLVIGDIKAHRAKLVLCASDLSQNSEKKLVNSAEFHKIRLIKIPVTMSELGHCTGAQKDVCAVAVTDANFSTLIISKI